MNPIEKAQAFQDSLELLGTQAKVAEKHDVSIATVSRYLKLLTLSEAEQQAVIDKKLPLELKPKRQKKAFSVSSEADSRLMIFSHARFLTAWQYAQYRQVSKSQAFNELSSLSAMGFVEKQAENKPHCFTLSSRGYQYLELHKPKHFMSASAIHQWLLRNQIELSIKEKNPNARFINRKQCWEIGFYPSVGEHLLRFVHQGKTQLALVLIDDYSMAASRISKSIYRLHDKNKTITTNKHTLKYADMVHTVLVYTTTESSVSRFNRHIQKITNFQGKIVTRFIQPIWSVA